MKAIKITKGLLKKTPVELMVEIGAVDMSTNRVFPDCVYLSKEDFKTLMSNFSKHVDKTYKSYSKHHRKGIVSFENLSYGPNEALKDVVKKGFILVDDAAIEAAQKVSV